MYAWVEEMDVLVHDFNPKNIICNMLHESPGHIVNFVAVYIKQYILLASVLKPYRTMIKSDENLIINKN